ncbi:MAG: hypothetical protein BGP05_13435 [Rhizobiales bacterium 62-47]|nr:hypothetical protein [Hyphomicrobiales bacterium]OJY11251.1 MAG: hypothetical protein BGP05_13435 [Rhizobiales bacterium 62-47]
MTTTLVDQPAITDRGLTPSSAPLPSPRQPTLDEALQGITIDDALASLTPEDLVPQPSGALASIRQAVTPPGTNAIGAATEAAAIGAAKGVLEAKDFIFGEPDAGDKWAMRHWIEQRGKDLRKDSVVNGVAQSIAQFGVGFMGLGKLKYVAKGIEYAAEAGKLAHFGAQTARGAVAGSIFMDPHEERLSNLVEQYPALSNPITGYLAAKHDDSAAEGRLKNGLEGIVMDTALAGALALVAKGIKLYRAGDLEAANKVAGEADEAFIKASAPPAPDAIDPAIANAAAMVREMDLKPSGPVMDAATGPMERVPGLQPDSMRSRIGGGEAGGFSDVAVRKEDAGSVGRNPTNGSGDGPDLVLRDGPIDGNNLSAAHGRNDGHGAEGLQDRSRETGSTERSVEGATGSGGTVEGTGRSIGVDNERGHPSAEDIDHPLKQLRDDTAALTTYGSREDAINAGYTFAPPSSSSSTGIIPWQKLRTTEETQAWMDHFITDHAAFINARRGGDPAGILTDKQVEAMVASRAKAWNENPANLIGMLKAAGDKAPDMAANMETSFLIANKAYQDAYELAARINAENYTGFGSRAEALAALQHRMAMATTMYANGKAIISNAARSMRRMHGEFRFSDQQLANITTADPEQLLKIVNETGGSPQLLAKAGRLTLLQKIVDPIAGMQAANLLWSWKTQVVNAATSTAMLVWRPLETGLGATMLKGLGKLRGDEQMIANASTIRQQSIREVTRLGSTLADGFEAARRAFIEGDSILVPRGQEHFHASGLQADNLTELAQRWRPHETMEDVVSNAMTAAMFGKAALTGSLRMLGAADEFVKTMRYRAVVTAKASLEADQRGLTAGSKDFSDYVSSRLDSAFDDAGRGIDKDAILEAQTSTFQQPYVTGDDTWFGRGWANGYGKLAADHALLRLITPFIKTPTNLMRYGVKLTPGANLLQKEYVRAISGQVGAEAQARAVGQMTLGIMLAATAISLWSKGTLTGSGPQDPQEAKQWRAEGNRPFSLSWTDDRGVRQFFDLNPLDPIASPLVLVADWAAIYTSGRIREDEAHGVGMSLMMAVMNRLKDKTYLKNIGDAINAMRDDNTLESWARRMAPGFLPWSSLMSSINPDPVMHEVRSMADALIAKIPGWSSSLPPARDVFGDPVRVQHGLISRQQHPSALTTSLDESFAITGHYLRPPAPRSESTGGVDLRDFILKDGRTAYDRYQELAGRPSAGAAPLREMLSALVQSKGFKALPHGAPAEDGTKSGMIMDVVSKYRRAAFKVLLSESPELRQAVVQRKLDISKAIAVGAKDVREVADRAKVNTFGRLLRSYGITLPSVSTPPQ